MQSCATKFHVLLEAYSSFILAVNEITSIYRPSTDQLYISLVKVLYIYLYFHKFNCELAIIQKYKMSKSGL